MVKGTDSGAQMLIFKSWICSLLCILNKILSPCLPVYFYEKRAHIYNTCFMEPYQELNESIQVMLLY